MKKNIILFGGGNHVTYSIDIIEKENKYNIMGIADPFLEIGTEIMGYKIVGKQEDIKELVKKYKIDAGIITIGDNWVRKLVYDTIINIIPDFEFVSAIHPSACIGKNSNIGEGTVIMAGCIINTNVNIGKFCFLATGAQIEHNCILSEFVSVSAGSITGGFVKIGKYSAITLGVTIIDRLSIGENTVVGSGSLVSKDLPDNVLAYGSPAKVVKSRKLNDRFLK